MPILDHEEHETYDNAVRLLKAGLEARDLNAQEEEVYEYVEDNGIDFCTCGDLL